jgi:hypothetical protein
MPESIMVNIDRRAGHSRRAILGTTTAGLAGCTETDGSADQTDTALAAPDDAPDQTTDAGVTRGFPGILVTSEGDGDLVTARDSEGVIAEDADAGRVMNAVFDAIESADGPQGRHIHFTRGLFRWHQQATTAARGVRITGEWNGTRWYADSEIRSYLRFAKEGGNIGRGPKISYLQYHGKGNAEYFLELDAVDEGNVEHIYGTETTKGMIFGKPEVGNQFLDNCRFRDLRLQRGGAIAVMESGAAGIPADCKFEACACLHPDTYAFVFRDVQRMQIDRVFAGFGEGTDGMGAVLIENPGVGASAAAKRKTMGCQINMAEMEDKREDADGICVHVRTPEDSESRTSYSHVLSHLRAQQRESTKFLVVEDHGPGTVEGIRLRGLQARPRHERAIVIDGAVECDLQFDAIGGKDPYEGRYSGSANNPASFVDDRGTRTILNGVSENAGSPAETGQWNDHGRRGVVVVDTEGGDLYTFADGQWWRFGTATA